MKCLPIRNEFNRCLRKEVGASRLARTTSGRKQSLYSLRVSRGFAARVREPGTRSRPVVVEGGAKYRKEKSRTSRLRTPFMGKHGYYWAQWQARYSTYVVTRRQDLRGHLPARRSEFPGFGVAVMLAGPPLVATLHRP